MDMQYLGCCGPLQDNDCSCSAHEETTLRAGEVKERWMSNKKRTGGREDIRKIGIC